MRRAFGLGRLASHTTQLNNEAVGCTCVLCIQPQVMSEAEILKYHGREPPPHGYTAPKLTKGQDQVAAEVRSEGALGWTEADEALFLTQFKLFGKNFFRYKEVRPGKVQ